jgi:LacI family transcriptional regulator
MNTSNEQVKRPPTVRDLAKLAGVSIGTVSRVLNDADNVAPEIRRRTLEAMRGAGYEPAARGRRRNAFQPLALQKGRAKSALRNIMVISPEMSPEWVGHELWIHFLAGIGKACEERSYSYSVGMSDSVAESLAKLCGPERAASGALVKLGNTRPADLAGFEAEAPLVGFGTYWAECPIPQIALDDYATGASAAKAILALGHKRVAFVSGYAAVQAFGNRANGYASAMKAAGLFDPELLIELPRVADGRSPQNVPPDMGEALSRLVAARATAAIFANDWAAFGFYRAAQAAGLKIPDQIGVMGIDDSGLCNVVSPSLSSMAMPFEDEAYFAACTIIDMIEGAGQHLRGRATVQYLPAKPVLRESLKKLEMP